MKRDLLTHYEQAAHSAGAKNLKGLPQPQAATQKAATYPYQVVEFDGHRLDVRLKIVIQDPLGLEQEFEIERIWLLVNIDVCTRAVLGYHLVLSREYSRYDVIKTIEKAISPHIPRTFTLNGVSYGAAGGFPSGKLPELGYAIWERIRLDNAKANLSNETITALCEFIGCTVDAEPQGTRGHITLFQVRYTNQVLAASGTLLGKDLRIYYNSDDLRTVRAFLHDGTEIGVLKAQGAWGEIVHDLKLRREIMKMRGRKKLGFSISQEFIDQFVDAKKTKAKRSRRAASDLERTLRTLAGAPTTKASSAKSKNPSPQVPSTDEIEVEEIVTSSEKKVEPQHLTIGFGFTSAL